MKRLLLITLLFNLSNAYSFEVPKSTENAGMNKYERINKIEQDLIRLAKEIRTLRTEFKVLKYKIKREVLAELKKEK